MINRCKQCNLPFHPLTKKHLYCNKCRGKGVSYYKKNKMEVKNCIICGKQFETNIKRKVYCGAECRNDADDRGGPLVTKICGNCGKPFKTKSKIKQYCVQECYREHKAKESKSEYKLSRPIEQ